jgi:hypothetical protein
MTIIPSATAACENVKVPCPNCGNGIEIDANQLAGYDACVAPCPHFGLDTDMDVAKGDHLPTTITEPHQATPVTTAGCYRISTHR